MGLFGHTWEIIIIAVVALLIFGPKRLPEMGASIGKSIKEFQKGMRELTSSHDDDEPSTSLESVERENKVKKAVDGEVVAEKTTTEKTTAEKANVD